MTDVFLRARFLLLTLLLLPAACATAPSASAVNCPQPRHTAAAPAEFLERKNPLAQQDQDHQRGRRLYESARSDARCVLCYGRTGEGSGELAAWLGVPPRNFTCTATLSTVPDGQLFWVIRAGSPDTSMPAHPQLSDDEIWLLVGYVRSLAR